MTAYRGNLTLSNSVISVGLKLHNQGTTVFVSSEVFEIRISLTTLAHR